MSALILDSEAISELAEHRSGGTVHAALTAALKASWPVRVPSAVLAEQYIEEGGLTIGSTLYLVGTARQSRTFQQTGH